MNIRFRLIPLIVLVGLAFLFMSAQPYAQSKDIRSEIAASSVLEKIKKRQTLRAGVSTFVPWVMRSKKGDLIGFEIDVAKKVAEDMGVKIEFVPTAFDGIIPALLTGKFDIIMTGIFVYPPWNLQINFSNPYNWGGMTLAANKKLTAGFDPNKDFNSSKVTITLRRGNQDGLTVIKRRFPKAQVRQFDDDAPAIQDVINGSAHAFITAEPKPTNYVLDYPEVLYKPFGKEYLMRNPSGFALRKGDYDIINWLNNWIILNTESGWLQERHEYWFLSRDWKGLTNQ